MHGRPFTRCTRRFMPIHTRSLLSIILLLSFLFVPSLRRMAFTRPNSRLIKQSYCIREFSIQFSIRLSLRKIITEIIFFSQYVCFFLDRRIYSYYENSDDYFDTQVLMDNSCFVYLRKWIWLDRWLLVSHSLVKQISVLSFARPWSRTRSVAWVHLSRWRGVGCWGVVRGVGQETVNHGTDEPTDRDAPTLGGFLCLP